LKKEKKNLTVFLHSCALGQHKLPQEGRISAWAVTGLFESPPQRINLILILGVDLQQDCNDLGGRISSENSLSLSLSPTLTHSSLFSIPLVKLASILT